MAKHSRVQYDITGIVWYGMVWHGMAWHGMVWYGMVWYGMVWYMVWYDMARYSTAYTYTLNISPRSYLVDWYNHQTIDGSSTFVRNCHPFLCVDLHSPGRLVACRSRVPVQARP